jgi:hypothetical protein
MLLLKIRDAGTLFLALMGLGIGGCSIVERAQQDVAVHEVSLRARERWDLLMTGQVDKAYDYLSPASRVTVTREAFRKRSSGGQWWRRFEVEKVDCGKDTCRVTISLEYDLKDIKGLKRSIDETWVEDQGVWWLVAAK